MAKEYKCPSVYRRPEGAVGGGVTGHDCFEDIISLGNLLSAWQEFVIGKRGKHDVQVFSLNLIDNIVPLHDDLAKRIYRHGPYQAFSICDPKPRQIHKATVRDRLLHHAIHRILYPFFSRRFIADSFSCQLGKGTHRALNRFRSFGYCVSRNTTRTCWVLKCDIKKFFANIDHGIMKNILARYIGDTDILWLLDRIIDSFHPGLPLGNLTSQLLVNIYMNEFDQWVKHRLKVKYYIRYADDFVLLSHDKGYLEELMPRIDSFLTERLNLTLHPDKVFIKTLSSGVDFLGWIHFPNHRILRTTTKRRMFKHVAQSCNPATIQSYLGMLEHGNAQKLKSKIGRPARGE
ncbi:MAG: reverse transcriptase/maturase family protein [Patescibacteria group bacterium]